VPTGSPNGMGASYSLSLPVGTAAALNELEEGTVRL